MADAVSNANSTAAADAARRAAEEAARAARAAEAQKAQQTQTQQTQQAQQTDQQAQEAQKVSGVEQAAQTRDVVAAAAVDNDRAKDFAAQQMASPTTKAALTTPQLPATAADPAALYGTPAAKTQELDHDPSKGLPQEQATAAGALNATMNQFERQSFAAQMGAKAGVSLTRQGMPDAAEVKRIADNTAFQLKEDAARQTLAPGVDPNRADVQQRLASMPMGPADLKLSDAEKAALRDPATREATATALGQRYAQQKALEKGFGGPENAAKVEQAWQQTPAAEKAAMAHSSTQNHDPGFLHGFIDGAADGVSGIVSAGKTAVDLATNPEAQKRVGDVMRALENPETAPAVIEAFRQQAGAELGEFLQKPEAYIGGYLAGQAALGLGAGKLLGSATALASDAVVSAARTSLNALKKTEQVAADVPKVLQKLETPALPKDATPTPTPTEVKPTGLDLGVEDASMKANQTAANRLGDLRANDAVKSLQRAPGVSEARVWSQNLMKSEKAPLTDIDAMATFPDGRYGILVGGDAKGMSQGVFSPEKMQASLQAVREAKAALTDPDGLGSKFVGVKVMVPIGTDARVIDAFVNEVGAANVIPFR